MMNKINFAGIEGKVLQVSPHGNYQVVELSDSEALRRNRITIVGTYSNKFHWPESTDESSGFTSFITYIGLKQQEFPRFRDWVIVNNGYFEGDDGTPRQSKRVRRFPLEIKVRGLLAESVVELIHGEIG
ncbi:MULTISPECIES: hypothetical protein [Dolichospermum]|jgi:hypothetical protein|uniref:Uncharacterized protein n=2 Tax=Cyanophyceae TaxID=3028117 RepID=A0ACC7SBA0_DOLFA|nr:MULTISPECIES: hypothetical protein [Dolichospermum]MBO1066498.1 hypothetical protein [Anabaena sp. 54]MTJ45276.1 hypothetical protein [Dolichospermum flos-aquae UHCC 0037]MDB9435282.1 hypothetical protein [Dolichospermum lemmermannii CS-548]MTJ16375.1 hypothetical protein [Dolichospermum sp. UHCC 0299]MTJ41707.1 hypothetical protein [Dolichospermum sp. UHCC 0406]